MPWGLHTKDGPGNGRVMIVDDEDNVRKVLRLTLAKAGYDVVEAQHGGEGIKTIGSDDNAFMLDVILCDIRMPKINGLEAIAFFQQQYPSVPIIVVTGYPDQKMATDLLSRGVFDYLVKPVEKEKLLQAVAAAMEKHLALRHDD